MTYAMTRRLPLLAVTLLALTLAACEGPAGPEGPEGPQGPPGAVNVETTTFTVRESDFSTGTNSEIAERSMSILTPEVVSEGAVLAYSDFIGEGWIAMPLSFPVNGSTVEYTFGFDSDVFRTIILRDEGSGAVAGAFSGSRVKVVAIPPSTAANAANAGAYESYEETADALNLE